MKLNTLLTESRYDRFSLGSKIIYVDISLDSNSENTTQFRFDISEVSERVRNIQRELLTGTRIDTDRFDKIYKEFEKTNTIISDKYSITIEKLGANFRSALNGIVSSAIAEYLEEIEKLKKIIIASERNDN